MIDEGKNKHFEAAKGSGLGHGVKVFERGEIKEG
jgi:hypothetical protein